MPDNRAAWATERLQNPLVVKEAPYPAVIPGHVIIKGGAVAINPIDALIQAADPFGFSYPLVFGLDVAGEIAEVGEGVTHLKKGQRVLALTNNFALKNPGGAFQEYSLAPASTVAAIPDTLSYETATVVGLGLGTAAAALYQKTLLGLPYPSLNPQPTGSTLLVWGGSSSVGSNAIQLARASGFEVIATGSTRNHGFLKELGASDVIDYSSSNVADEILVKLKGKKLVGIFDTVSKDETLVICRKVAKAFGLTSVTGVLPRKVGEEDGIRYTAPVATDIQNNEVGPIVFRDYLPEALSKGVFLPKPDPIVVGKGLDSIQAGIDRYRAGVSANKVVVSLA